MKKVFQVLFAGSIIFSIVFLLALSLGRRWSYPAMFPEQWTLDNWSSIFSSNNDLGSIFLVSLGVSITIAFLTTALAFFTSKHIAYSRHRNRLMIIAYLPYVLAPVILAATLQFYFIFVGLSGTIAGVMLAQFFIAYPFGVIILNSFWNEKIRAMEHLSSTLGSNAWNTFRKVLLPISKNALLLCFFQTFLVSWFEFGLTNLIGVGTIPTLTVSVFGYVNEANLFYASLACCLLILPPMALIWFNKRYIFRTETGV
jgi:putative spermidine/putrescine transport system permease protein